MKGANIMNHIDLRHTIHEETANLTHYETFNQTSEKTWECEIHVDGMVLKADGVCDNPLNISEKSVIICQLTALMYHRYSSYAYIYLLQTFGQEEAIRLTRDMTPWMFPGRCD